MHINNECNGITFYLSNPDSICQEIWDYIGTIKFLFWCFVTMSSINFLSIITLIDNKIFYYTVGHLTIEWYLYFPPNFEFVE